MNLWQSNLHSKALATMLWKAGKTRTLVLDFYCFSFTSKLQNLFLKDSFPHKVIFSNLRIHSFNNTPIWTWSQVHKQFQIKFVHFLHFPLLIHCLTSLFQILFSLSLNPTPADYLLTIIIKFPKFSSLRPILAYSDTFPQVTRFLSLIHFILFLNC